MYSGSNDVTLIVPNTFAEVLGYGISPLCHGLRLNTVAHHCPRNS